MLEAEGRAVRSSEEDAAVFERCSASLSCWNGPGVAALDAGADAAVDGGCEAIDTTLRSLGGGGLISNSG